MIQKYQQNIYHNVTRIKSGIIINVDVSPKIQKN